MHRMKIRVWREVRTHVRSKWYDKDGYITIRQLLAEVEADGFLEWGEAHEEIARHLGFPESSLEFELVINGDDYD